MTENMKRFLEAVSGNEELQKKITDLNDKHFNEMLSVARETGIELNKSDFIDSLKSKEELGDNELENVAGGQYTCGSSDCSCVAVGSGAADVYQKKCFCIAAGAGELTDFGKQEARAGRIKYCGSSSAPVAMYCALGGLGIMP